jgi:hypothetical protein
MKLIYCTQIGHFNLQDVDYFNKYSTQHPIWTKRFPTNE